ncbi:MAG: FAD-dependent oxidoreductase [Candidatus Peribacteraceae bacterium]|jgi:ferredoxin-NADP reductase|nr:FAD-dependent oxidoreductase [Candidatus Peribacteraceae bacterium]MDP7454811.1 FAD-dependent oxidoreductase [Candidatus Peribacteraceae bacterium]MDP7646151.1 FAD-dependent oxidoreductase [Candidatus Peribacteraceae bacterium]
MPTPSYTVTCRQNMMLKKDIHELKFTRPRGFDFKPGQFILFQVPDIDNPEDFQPRAYSIASTPDEDELMFIVRIVPEGRAGKWFYSMLTEGTDVEMQGPMGNFSLNPDNPKDYLFVGTGVGLAPFISQVRSILTNGESRNIDLVWCTYNENSSFWVEELKAFEEKYSNFNFHLSYTDPPPEWEGLTGRVQQVIPTIPDFKEKQFYICGNPAMTTDVKKICLEEWGLDKKDIHIEGYI